MSVSAVLGTFCMVGSMLVVGLLAMVLLWRMLRSSRPPTRPTYDDRKIRSGGSIGGDRSGRGKRAYDDPRVRSGGSIGGGRDPSRTNDDPNIRSGGSIGGGPRREEPRQERSSGESGGERPRHDDPNIRSGGSFGR